MKWSVIQKSLNQGFGVKNKKKAKQKKHTSGFKVMFREESLKKRTKAEIQAKAFLDLKLKENTDYFQEFIFQNRRFDFFVPKLNLVIEIDGGYHNQPEQKIKDLLNDRVFLEKYQIKVIRVKNEDVSLILPDLVNKLFLDLVALNNQNRLNKAVKNSLRRMKKIISFENQRKKRVNIYMKKTILRKAKEQL